MANDCGANETKVEEKAINLKPEGQYKGEVLSHALELSSKRTLGLKLMVRVTHQETEEGEWEELDQPFSRPVFLWMSENAKQQTADNLKWFGYAETTASGLNPNKPGGFSFRGKEIFLTCKHDTYKDKPKEQWNMQRRAKPEDIDAAITEADAWFKDEMEAVLNPEAALEDVKF